MTSMFYGADGLFYQVSSGGSKALRHRIPVSEDGGLSASLAMVPVDDLSGSASRIHP
ncbi:MAG: hypothetical protein V1721_07050 [Pseudomonadota bacterium]